MKHLLYISSAFFILLLVLSCNSNTSEADRMEAIWKTAQEHRDQNVSMSEDTLLPRALKYFREQKDTAKLLEGYMLEVLYLKWHDQQDAMVAVLDSGLNYSIQLKDTTQIINFYRAKAEIFYMRNQFREAANLSMEVLKYSDKLSVSTRYSMIYRLALNLALINDPDYGKYLRQSIDMAIAAKDTTTAAHFMRNMADIYAANHKYAESNEMIHQVMQLMPSLNQRSILQITLAGNYINLHQKDSFRYYVNIANEHESQLQAKGEGDIARKSILILFQSIQNYADGYPISATKIGRFCDSIRNVMTDKQNTISQQLETKNKLQQVNYELLIDRQRTQLILLLVSILLICTAIATYLYIRNRYKRLAEAEDRIDTLKRMLEDTQKVSEDTTQVEDETFFKKLLLQQLGIIRLIANTPTTQNQELLRRISSISNKEIPVNSLLVWNDLYPLIDKLYDGFYSRLTTSFGNVLSDKEMQICCLLCAKFSTKEIGVITQQTSATIYVRKSSIRKKIGMGEGDDIIEHLNHI